MYLGLDASDSGLATVLESLGFCLKLRGSEASMLEDLEKAINLVHARRDLVESGRALLDHANKAQNEYERCDKYQISIFPFFTPGSSKHACLFAMHKFLIFSQTRNWGTFPKLDWTLVR